LYSPQNAYCNSVVEGAGAREKKEYEEFKEYKEESESRSQETSRQEYVATAEPYSKVSNTHCA
jgi:hypothetical protein